MEFAAPAWKKTTSEPAVVLGQAALRFAMMLIHQVKGNVL